MASLDVSTDSLFDDDWKAFGGDEVGLGAITAFNASFDGQQDSQCNVGSGLDPQLFSATSSPAMSLTTFGTSNSVSMPISSLDGMIPDFYPMAPPHAFDSAAGHIFHPSVEHHDTVTLQQPLHPSYNFRNQLHRRSVSEPPDQYHLPGHHFPSRPAPSNPTFTRAGVPLGAPRASAARQNGRGKEPMYRQPYSVAKKQAPRQERYQLRRMQTQPGRSSNGPTSMPQMPVARSPMSTSFAVPAQSAFVSSRVCTPAPSPNSPGNPNKIDPRLLSDSNEKVAREGQQAAAIPVTIDELKTMIVDAVQQALRGTNIEDPHNVVGGVSNNSRVAEPDEVANGTTDEDDPMECMNFDVGENVVDSIEEDNIVVKTE